MNLDNLIAILPLAVLIFWAVLLLLVDLWIPKERKCITAILAAVGLALSLALTLVQNGRTTQAFSGMVMVDGFAIFLNVIFLASGLAAVALAYDYLKRMGIERGEYYVLLLFSISGMMLMAYANDLIVVFLALELLSIPLYVLAGFARPRTDSEEAALKYFLLGAFASGFVLYGIALIFGATGHTDLPGIVASHGRRHRQFITFHHRRGLAAGRFWLQSGGCALPHVDAGCLPGRAFPGHRLHVGGSQGGRLRRPAARLHGDLPRRSVR